MEYLGTDAQRALLARGEAMWRLLGQDPAYTYYGRTVGLADPEPSGIAKLTALARLQGNASFADVPRDQIPDLRAESEALGLVVAHYTRWCGAARTFAQAEAILADTPLPSDLTIHTIVADTPPATLAAFGRMAGACGVLPPALSVLRGGARPGICVIAQDAGGAVVACAGAAAILHADHPDGARECWWGMLSTDPARRGARLSLVLGARALLAMRDRYGFDAIMTGVEPGNAASEAVCTRLGLVQTERAVFGVADPSLVPGGRMTK